MLDDSVAELKDVAHLLVAFVQEVPHLKEGLATTVTLHGDTQQVEYLRGEGEERGGGGERGRGREGRGEEERGGERGRGGEGRGERLCTHMASIVEVKRENDGGRRGRGERREEREMDEKRQC